MTDEEMTERTRQRLDELLSTAEGRGILHSMHVGAIRAGLRLCRTMPEVRSGIRAHIEALRLVRRVGPIA